MHPGLSQLSQRAPRSGFDSLFNGINHAASSPVITSALADFETLTNIGSVAAPVRLATGQLLLARSTGKSGLIHILFDPSIANATIGTVEATTKVVIETPNQLASNGDITADEIDFRATSFSLGQSITAGSSLTLRDQTTAITNANVFAQINAPSLIVDGDVGTSAGSPFFLSNPVSEITSLGGNFFVNHSFVDSVTIKSSSPNTLVFDTLGLLTLDGNISANAGVVDVDTSGTKGVFIRESSQITARDNIFITNSNLTKGKMAIGANVIIATSAPAKVGTAGDVRISVGPQGAPLATDPANTVSVENGGTVNLTGSGVKAKSPVNTFTAQNADVFINNGFKANLFSVGGGVSVTADPPVPAGTSTFYSSGPVRYFEKPAQLHATTFGAGRAEEIPSIPKAHIIEEGSWNIPNTNTLLFSSEFAADPLTEVVEPLENGKGAGSE